VALRDRPVEGVDSELIERLVVGEPPCHAVVGDGGALPGSKDGAQARRDRRVGVTGQQPALPCAPAARRGGNRQRATVAVEIEYGRNGAGGDRGGENQGVGLADRALALGQP
jgi:hypothetical protein